MASRASTKRITNILLTILLIAGAGLIVFLFFFLIPEEKRTNTTWLNFGVILWLEVLVFGMFRFLSSQTKKHEEVLPAFFASGVVVTFYVILAIIGVLLSFANLGFKTLVTIQLVLFFVFFVIEIIVLLATRVAGDVVQEEKAKKEGIHTIRGEMDLLKLKFDKLPNEFSQAKQEILQVKEDVRFTSPNGKPQAQKYEQDILLKINDLKAILTEISYTDETRDEEAVKSKLSFKLEELKDLVTLRKRMYS